MKPPMLSWREVFEIATSDCLKGASSLCDYNFFTAELTESTKKRGDVLWPLLVCAWILACRGAVRFLLDSV